MERTRRARFAADSIVHLNDATTRSSWAGETDSYPVESSAIGSKTGYVTSLAYLSTGLWLKGTRRCPYLHRKSECPNCFRRSNRTSREHIPGKTEHGARSGTSSSLPCPACGLLRHLYVCCRFADPQVGLATLVVYLYTRAHSILAHVPIFMRKQHAYLTTPVRRNI